MDHEVLDDAVKHRVVVVTGLDVSQKVGDRLGRLGFVQLQRDDAVVLDVQFDLGVGHVVFLKIT